MQEEHLLGWLARKERQREEEIKLIYEVFCGIVCM
jgi:hypothetical protein